MHPFFTKIPSSHLASILSVRRAIVNRKFAVMAIAVAGAFMNAKPYALPHQSALLYRQICKMTASNKERGIPMTAQLVDEFLVLEKYRVMVLDQNVSSLPHAHYRINGETFDPIMLHSSGKRGTVPMNYIAIKGTSSFKGSTVEFV